MKKILTLLLGLFAFCGCADRSAVILPEKAVLLDVRSQAEYDAGHIRGAICIPHDQIREKIAAAVPLKNTPLYIYCRSGRRVKIAIETLRALGYTDLHDLGGMADAEKILQNTREK